MGGKKGGGIGGIAKTALDPLDISGKAGGLLFGKKDKGIADRFIPLDPLQEKAMKRYGELMDTNTDQIAKNTIATQERNILQGARDTERNAQKLVAQRGLSNSSVGLNALVNANRGLDDRLGAVRAQLPGMQYDMRAQNLGNATNGIQNILGSRTFIQGTPGGGRKGGLAPFIGAGIGGYMGGAGGAQAGMGIGQMMTQL